MYVGSSRHSQPFAQTLCTPEKLRKAPWDTLGICHKVNKARSTCPPQKVNLLSMYFVYTLIFLRLGPASAAGVTSIRPDLSTYKLSRGQLAVQLQAYANTAAPEQNVTVMQSVSRGVTDIGVMAPPSSHGFFTKCGFCPDRQDLGSQAMAIMPEVWMPQTASLPVWDSAESDRMHASQDCKAFNPDSYLLNMGLVACLDSSVDRHQFQHRRLDEVWHVPGRQRKK